MPDSSLEPSRARSRLTAAQAQPSVALTPVSTLKHSFSSLTSPLSQLSFRLSRLQLFSALIAAVSAFGLLYLLTTVSPAAVANWGYFQSYLPLHLLRFIFCTSLSYIFVHSLRRPTLLVLPFILLFALHLLSVVLTPVIIGSIILVLWGSEVLLTLLFKR